MNILSLDLPALATACEALGIDKLSDQDICFLQEFTKVLQPIADAITLLEGSKNMFGTYLPTLFGVRTKLRDMHLSDELLYCRPLLDAIRDGFHRRFAHLMSLGNLFAEPDPRAAPLFISMLSNPRFKLNFIPRYWFDENTDGMHKIQNLLLNVMKQMVAKQQLPVDEQPGEGEGSQIHQIADASVSGNDNQPNDSLQATPNPTRCKFTLLLTVLVTLNKPVFSVDGLKSNLELEKSI